MKAKEILQPPSIEVGDDILIGKFLNKKAKVKGFKKDDHNQPVLKTNKGDVRLLKPRLPKLEEAESNTLSPEFERWFAGSKAVDASGQPLKLYHGTSKDVDFKAFRMPKHGIWFCADPKSASEYSMENDSQDIKYDFDTRNFKHTNTASRVIPVYVKMLNPKYAKHQSDLFPPELKNSDNYRKAQGIAFDKLRAEGYDSIILDGGIYVLLDYNAPNKIKSAISNKNYSDKKKNIHENKKI